MRWLDVDARAHEERFDGWLARILFHELELLDGRFFTDHLARTALPGLGGPQPLRVLTLPPELRDLRRSVLHAPAAPVADSGIRPRALERLLGAMREAMDAAGLERAQRRRRSAACSGATWDGDEGTDRTGRGDRWRMEAGESNPQLRLAKAACSR